MRLLVVESHEAIHLCGGDSQVRTTVLQGEGANTIFLKEAQWLGMVVRSVSNQVFPSKAVGKFVMKQFLHALVPIIGCFSFVC